MKKILVLAIISLALTSCTRYAFPGMGEGTCKYSVSPSARKLKLR